MTTLTRPRLRGPADCTPTDAADLVEVLDTMRAVLGAPEAMDDPRCRARYLLNETRLAAACRKENR